MHGKRESKVVADKGVGLVGTPVGKIGNLDKSSDFIDGFLVGTGLTVDFPRHCPVIPGHVDRLIQQRKIL